MSKCSGIAGRMLKALKDQAGGTAIVFSVAIAVVIGCGGLAIDYARTKMTLSAIQANLDAAVLAGVTASLIEKHEIETAKAFFSRYTAEHGVTVDVRFEVKKGVLTGTADASVPTSFLKILDIDQMGIKAKSAATASEALEPICFMAMHPTRKHTLELKGSVSVYGPRCNIYGNSNHDFDVIDPHTPKNFVTAKFVGTIGGGHHFLPNVSPPPEFGTRVIEDPLADLAMPAPGACTQTKYTISGKSMTLPQGSYCGGLSITNGSKVDLQDDGVYFISGGAFTINSSKLTGKNVTIFLVDARTTVEWINSVVRISAKKTGDFAGIAVFGARVETDNAFTTSTIDIHGAFYMPLGAFTWENDGEPAVTAKWSAFVIDGVSWIGKGTIRYNFDISNSDIPYPEALIAMPRPAKARLVN